LLSLLGEFCHEFSCLRHFRRTASLPFKQML